MGHGDMEQLVLQDAWPTPEPAPGEVVIKVGACGLDNTDVNTRVGWYSKAVSEATSGEGYETIDVKTRLGAAHLFPFHASRAQIPAAPSLQLVQL